jgi:hydroxymethylpyrimidine pyrophosphatase-like HAD family hydrolase
MSFGDGGNDITMLAHTHIGIAMGNANPEVKEIADYITDSVDENGIWNALKHFNII